MRQRPTQPGASRGRRRHYYRQERSYGAFERSIHVPAGVRTEDITASYDAGILGVIVPKAARHGSTRIQIHANGKKTLTAAGT
ncbi:MAG TPA: Hsp20/alpha crystallin family protein [Mycobacteriales bacterium]|nr:Hsp20/alpha crystallin family protein [Mycobacteriales bacterium]